MSMLANTVDGEQCRQYTECDVQSMFVQMTLCPRFIIVMISAIIRNYNIMIIRCGVT